MKELLKHYKEVSEKANPDNWGKKKYEIICVHYFCSSLVEDLKNNEIIIHWYLKSKGNKCDLKDGKEYDTKMIRAYYTDKPNFVEFQKEKLEIENLLYWDWFRNNTDGLIVNSQKKFNQWLKDELDKIK
ncbi:MAG: hypothetical protein MPJ22_13075 [Pirellulales bacterium]|nr:hypothetical protein [Pirellulales bacterium]